MSLGEKWYKGAMFKDLLYLKGGSYLENKIYLMTFIILLYQYPMLFTTKF